MAYKPQPWPCEMHGNYQAIYNELLRIQSMLETCLAEYEVDNPYMFDTLLPNIKKRIFKIEGFADEILLYAPEGQGPPPKWLKTAKKLVQFLSVVYKKLDSPELKRQITQNRYPEIERLVKSILAGTRQAIEQLNSVPLEESSLIITQSGFKEVVLEVK